MSGYINVDKNELPREQQSVYHAYYCGLCRMLRTECGKKGRTILNCNLTFLVVLLSGLYELDETEEEFVCPFHPTKKSRQIVNGVTEYVSHMNIILAYNDLADECREDNAYTRKTVGALFQKDYERIAPLYPRQIKAVEDYLRHRSACEVSGEQNIDLAAGNKGELVGEIFAWREDEWYTELRNMGFYMGKFLYLMDAYEKLDRDEKRNQYNALQCMRRDCDRDFETISRQMMNSMVAECIRSFERLPILLHADILRNVLYSGVWTRYEEIQNRREKSAWRKK